MADTALKIDPVEVNVDLAKKYLELNNENIKYPKWEQRDEMWHKNYDLAVASLPMLHKKLIKRIIENTALICQLEYLKNNTPIDVSEKNIKLLIQYLSLNQQKYKVTERGTEVILPVTKNTPLAGCAFLVECCYTECDERAAVCYLFKTLCIDSGFPLRYDGKRLNKDDELSTMCTGIISESSDLDSAVDALLSSPSSSNCFWRLHRILVQESIYASFKKLLDIKTALKGPKESQLSSLRDRCSDVFVYENKALLVDFAGDARALSLDGAHAVFIEAYRTNKELLSIVGEPGCVSLWSSDVASANEIAYGLSSSLVWINDYGNFDGPPEISTVLLSQMKPSGTYPTPNSFVTCHETWKKMDSKKRMDIISGVVEKEMQAIAKLDAKDEKVRERTQEIVKLQEKISNLKFNSVSVDGGKICVVLERAIGIHFDKKLDECVIQSLILGNGVICGGLSTFYLYNELEQAGIPLISYEDWHSVDEENAQSITVHNFRFRTKVVISNFGTIFAN